MHLAAEMRCARLLPPPAWAAPASLKPAGTSVTLCVAGDAALTSTPAARYLELLSRRNAAADGRGGGAAASCRTPDRPLRPARASLGAGEAPAARGGRRSARGMR